MRNKVAAICWAVAKHWKISLPVLAMIFIAGGFSYFKLLPREGFPSIQFPLTVVNVTSFGNDAKALDEQISVPISKKLSDNSGVDSVQFTVRDNFATAIVAFNQDVDPTDGTRIVKKAFDELKDKPTNLEIEYTSVKPTAYLNKYDALVAVYAEDGQTVEQQQEAASRVAANLVNLKQVRSASVEELIAEQTNPITQEKSKQQIYFNSVGVKKDGKLKFYPAITVGVIKDKDYDVIALSDALNLAIEKQDNSVDGFGQVVSADFADGVENQISSLQSNLLTGIVIVMIVTALLIGFRASIISAIFMVGVVFTTTLIFYFIGYTLNTITLFALVLTLGLFVDDATIMIEGIDAESKKFLNRKSVLKSAGSKVALASLAGTLTTALVFAPLVFVSGILGDFIKLMPVTVIISLLVSYVLAIVLVPVLARFTILSRNAKNHRQFGLQKFERKIANGIAASILWIKTKPKLGTIWRDAMFVLSIGFVIAAILLAKDLKFNIFPPSRDADQIRGTVSFAPGTSLNQAQGINDQLNSIISEQISDYSQGVVFGGFSQSNERSSDFVVQLTPEEDRSGEQKASDIINQLEPKLRQEIGREGSVKLIQVDAGPPATEFPFMVQINEEDTTKLKQLSEDISKFLDGNTVKKPNGDEVKIAETRMEFTDGITRINQQRALQVSARFDDSDTSALVSATQRKLERKFSQQKLKDSGFQKNALKFDFGQESDNAESFSSLGLIFPIAIGLMFILLALQFKSLLQPLLILLAIPFSMLGVVVALLLTDNALSFFSMVGAIGLIGIAVNNTILLTDYTNQARKEGMDTIDALAYASRERFRPLITTTLTTVTALLPLAIFDPFWQPLAVVIIGGLLSSTFLVVLAFPHYYNLFSKFIDFISIFFRDRIAAFKKRQEN
ncbi:efflux RND transporter permease subunit [Candidatus Saccharibacteria bacterium]|nr:efflux RND transporter permease subunit [Candidatus Saccharibacteria bacterium]